MDIIEQIKKAEKEAASIEETVSKRIADEMKMLEEVKQKEFDQLSLTVKKEIDKLKQKHEEQIFELQKEYNEKEKKLLTELENISKEKKKKAIEYIIYGCRSLK